MNNYQLNQHENKDIIPYMTENKRNNKYFNTEMLNTISKYEFKGEFKNGFTRVKLNGKWGFIDENGNEISNLEFHKVRDFSDGLAAVQMKNKWGFINTKGKLVIKFEFIQTEDFINGTTLVYDGKMSFTINKNGNTISIIGSHNEIKKRNKFKNNLKPLSDRSIDFKVRYIKKNQINGTASCILCGEEFYLSSEHGEIGLYYEKICPVCLESNKNELEKRINNYIAGIKNKLIFSEYGRFFGAMNTYSMNDHIKWLEEVKTKIQMPKLNKNK